MPTSGSGNPFWYDHILAGVLDMHPRGQYVGQPLCLSVSVVRYTFGRDQQFNVLNTIDSAQTSRKVEVVENPGVVPCLGV